MDDNPVLLVKPTRTANFTPEEDLRLASAYVFVSLDPAVGTDQDGNTFWTKIRESFVNRGGLAARTMQSLKARWNKVINAEIGKYVGHLQGVFREYHSGWAMGDYVTKAKSDYQRTQGKAFKHEVLYNMLRTKMPKYEIEVESIDQRVVRALFLLDSDNTAATRARAEEEESGIDDTTAAGVITGNADHDADDTFGLGGSSSLSDKSSDGAAPVAAPGTASLSYQMQHSYTTPRPSIGKKKAKAMIAFASKNNKRTKVELTAATIPQENRSSEIKIRNESLSRIASAAEAKNQLARDQMMLQFFMLNPTSAAAVTFFEAKALEYSIAPTGRITASAEETAIDENEEDDDIVEVLKVRVPELVITKPLPEDSGVLSPLLITPAAAAKRSVGLIVNIDEDDDDVHGDALPTLALPDTQVMFGALIEAAAAAKKPNQEEDVESDSDGTDSMSNCVINKEDDVDDNIDTQMTTLSN
jgi:hypothetical protein